MTVWLIKFGGLAVFACGLMSGGILGAMVHVWWMERHHHCLPHDPSRCETGGPAPSGVAGDAPW